MLLRVRVEDPARVNASEPASVPPKVTAAELLTVSVAAEPVSVTRPVPPRPPTVWEKPAISKVPAELTFNVESGDKTLFVPMVSVPALTVREPLKPPL